MVEGLGVSGLGFHSKDHRKPLGPKSDCFLELASHITPEMPGKTHAASF